MIVEITISSSGIYCVDVEKELFWPKQFPDNVHIAQPNMIEIAKQVINEHITVGTKKEYFLCEFPLLELTPEHIMNNTDKTTCPSCKEVLSAFQKVFYAKR